MSMLDAICECLYGMTCEGWHDDETGDVTENGHWYGKLDGPIVPTEEQIRDFGLTREHIDTLAGCAGAIVSTDSDGSIDYEIFTDKDEFEGRWKQYESEYDEWFDSAQDD